MNMNSPITPVRASAARLFGLGLLVACFGFVVDSPAVIDDIRMCAVQKMSDNCPTDNPVFENDVSNISIDVRSSDFKAGEEIRFTWYRLDDSEFFSTYLGSVYETVGPLRYYGGTVIVRSTFPEGQEVIPGNYEVIVHGPREAKPVIKNFKVLD